MGPLSGGHVGEEVASSGNRRTGPSCGHGLPVDGEVRMHTITLRGASERDPETADRLVEDEHGAVLLANPADRLEIAGIWQDHTGVDHDRLHDHGGGFAGALGHDLLKRLDVVPLEKDDVSKRGRGLALAGRRSLGALVAGVDVVDPAVIVAVEPDDAGPAR